MLPPFSSEAAMQRSESGKNSVRIYLLQFAVFLLNFSRLLSSVLLLNQMLKQACLQSSYDTAICDEISENGNKTAKIEQELQPFVANIYMAITLMYTSIPAFLQLFLVPWSDNIGRKPILGVASIGYALTMTSTAVACYYSENDHPLSPWIYVLCSLPVNVLGGWSTVLTVTLCYITDLSDETSKRALHFTLIELLIVFGFLSAALTCSAILALANNFAVFATSAVCAISASIIIIAFVDESVETSANFRAVLSTRHIVEMLKTCWRPRALNDRRILLCLMVIVILNRLSIDGDMNVDYLFERAKFEWTLADHNYYQSASIVMTIVGTTAAMFVLKKVLNLPETLLVCLAVFSNFGDNLLKAFASSSWQLYAISAVTFVKLVVHPLCRSLMSSLVAHEEIGKVMSLTTFFGSLANFVAPPVFVAVYEATYTTFAGAFYLVSAGCCLVNFFVALYVMAIAGRTKHMYTEID